MRFSENHTSVRKWITGSPVEQFGMRQTEIYPKYSESKKISNDQELIQSDPISCPQNQKGK